jgi:hypothetical protein
LPPAYTFFAFLDLDPYNPLLFGPAGPGFVFISLVRIHVSTDKSDWLAACIAPRWLALYWSFFSGVGVKFAQSSSQWKQGPIPEDMSQTLLMKWKQGNLD